MRLAPITCLLLLLLLPSGIIAQRLRTPSGQVRSQPVAMPPARPAAPPVAAVTPAVPVAATTSAVTAQAAAVQGSSGLPSRHDLLERAERAASIIREFMEAPDGGIPRNMLERANCVAVFPSVKKGGFGIGGQWGRGVISCRHENKGWGNPAYFNLSGGSFGLQIGLQVVDLVMIISTRSGMDALMHNKVELGAGAAATAGIVGRNTSLSTDVLLEARIFSYSRSRGLYAGLELKGSYLSTDEKANRAMYRISHSHEILSTAINPQQEPLIGSYPRALNDISPSRVVYVKVPRSRLQQPPPPATPPAAQR